MLAQIVACMSKQGRACDLSARYAPAAISHSLACKTAAAPAASIFVRRLSCLQVAFARSMIAWSLELHDNKTRPTGAAAKDTALAQLCPFPQHRPSCPEADTDAFLRFNAPRAEQVQTCVVLFKLHCRLSCCSVHAVGCCRIVCSVRGHQQPV